MSKFVWSPAQELAIKYTDSNVLISAGAGSGKTAVLTERIYQLVKNGADLNRFLVLTFTNAAAAEMKTRIRKKIVGDENTKHLAIKIETSHIETFDAFALFLVKKYAFRLGLSPNIKVIDNTLLTIEQNKIRDNIITYLYDTYNGDFIDLVNTYCVKNDKQIREYINSICRVAELSRNRDEFLDSFIDTYFDENRLNGFVDEKYQMMVSTINEAINNAYLLEDEEDATAIIDSLKDLLDKGKDYDSLVTAYSTYKFPAKPRRADYGSEMRDAIKGLLSKVMALNETFGLRKDIINQYMSTKKHVATLIDIVKKVEKQLDAFKKEKNSYSFSDIANFALQILDIPEICEDMKNYFQYILVDEYQDTSALQEIVINKLSKNNVCMVGDVKQSIYRFRFADCTIFQEKYNLYKDNEGGKLIALNTSYRSRHEIVDLVNEMFASLMDERFNPIDYKDGHTFEYGFTKYNSLLDKKDDDYKLKVYRYQVDPLKGVANQEIDIMAIDIINKINNKYQVYDPSIDAMRDCTFKDFAIIIDRGTWFEDIKEKFSEYGIPTKMQYDESVKDSTVAYVLKNLLIIYDSVLKQDFENPKFVHAYVSIARSFLMQYSDQAIYEIVKDHSYSQTSIIEKMNSVVSKVDNAPLSNVLKTIVEEFEIYKNAIKLTHFAANTNKIELFVNLTFSMDELGFDIADLIQYFEDLKTFDLDIPYVDTDVGENSVTLITIHRSKGLEYPFIYLPGLTSRFPGGNSTAFLIDQKYGAVLPKTGNNTPSSLFNHLIKYHENKERFEERLRLLYVAVTRARERVIMLYGQKENDNTLVLNPASANNYKTLINYLGYQEKYGVDFGLTYEPLKNPIKQLNKITVEQHNIDVEPEEIIKKKASKQKDDSVNDSLLEFGTEIHYLLEIADYETRDLSFIKDGRKRKYINNVLSAKIFENVKNNEVLHEFSFFDEKNGVSGTIDCLIKKKDEIDIVDFKLKHLDDEKYVLQLHTYRDYIKQITDLPIKMYLISAITGEVKEIE